MESVPKTMHYLPNFITPAEEQQLCNEIDAQPKPKWTVLSHRRLQTHPSALTATNVLLAASPSSPSSPQSALPSWLAVLVPRMQALGMWASSPHRAPNHVLVNEYRPGQGIMPHEDGPAYYGCVATVSLGAPIVLDIYEKGSAVGGPDRVPRWRILQEPRRFVPHPPCSSPPSRS